MERKDKGNSLHIILLALYLPAIGLFFVNWSIALISILALIAAEIVSYFRYKASWGRDLRCLAYISNMLKVAEQLGCNDEDNTFKLTSSGVVSVLCGRFAGSNAGNPLTILLDYVRMLTHLDIILLNRNIKEIQDNYNRLDAVITRLAYLDLCISVSRLREALEKEQGFCTPVYEQGSIIAKNLYHPIIKEPVPNSIVVDREVLITGSNSSGKTTFLKTMAVNAILARTINTVLGSELKMPYCSIYSSLAPADDLIKGNSYYVAEVNSCKRIFDAPKAEIVLCFVDEILRGTNTIERIAASSQILKALAGPEYICLAATHDSELCDLLGDVADNYHFQEEYIDGDIVFSYKIQKGKCEKRNAIKLLERAGFPEAITERAESMVEDYIESKKWVLK